MANRIERVTLLHRRVSPMEAEVWVVVLAQRVDGGTALQGKLTGPKCPGVESVQVAYPLRLIPRPSDQPENVIVGRIIIPEPNLWGPEMPFAYDGIVELIQDGVRCDAADLSTFFRRR